MTEPVKAPAKKATKAVAKKAAGSARKPATKVAKPSVKSIPMVFERSTKGTHVYNEEVADSGVRSLYITKDAMPTPPARIIVHIEHQ